MLPFLQKNMKSERINKGYRQKTVALFSFSRQMGWVCILFQISNSVQPIRHVAK